MTVAQASAAQASVTLSSYSGLGTGSTADSMYLSSPTDTRLPRTMLAEKMPAVIWRVAGRTWKMTRRKRNTIRRLAADEEIHRYWIWERNLELCSLADSYQTFMDYGT